MSFQSLPVEVQVVAAKVLGEMIMNPENKKEPAELAQEVVSAFKVLSESNVEHLALIQTARMNDLLSAFEAYFLKLSNGNCGESSVV